jgi:hypothetical protein
MAIWLAAEKGAGTGTAGATAGSGKRQLTGVKQLTAGSKDFMSVAVASRTGHMAATTCLYAGLAILIIGRARGWWRYLFLIPAIVMPVMIALARLYRGEHHPTDILASLLFAALWLTAATMLIKPAANGPYRGGRLPRHEDASRSRRAVPGSLTRASAAGPASTNASEQGRTG